MRNNYFYLAKGPRSFFFLFTCLFLSLKYLAKSSVYLSYLEIGTLLSLNWQTWQTEVFHHTFHFRTLYVIFSMSQISFTEMSGKYASYNGLRRISRIAEKQKSILKYNECLELAQQMAIDSFWWILALISDQTMYEALKENVFISSLTLIKIWICSFWIMSTYNSCQFCPKTVCVILAYQTTVYLKSEQISVIARNDRIIFKSLC